MWAGAAFFVLNLGFGVVLPWSPELVGVASPANALAVSALAYALGKLVIQVPAGGWVDRDGASRWLAPALLAYVASLGMMLLGHPAAFLAGRALEGLATGVAQVAILAVVAQGDPDKVGARIGQVTGIGTAGILAGPALAVVAGSGGPVLPVALAAVAGVVVAVTAPRIQGRRLPPPSTAARVALLRMPLFVAVVLPIVFGKLSFTAVQGILPLHGPPCCGRDAQGVALWLLWLGLAFGITQPLGGWLADRVSWRRVALACWPVGLLGLLVVGLGTGDRVITGGLLLYAVGQSLVFAATMRALLHERWPVGRGSALGVHGSLTDLAILVGPTVFVALYGRVGGQALVGVAGAGLLLLLAFAWLALFRPAPAPGRGG